MKAEAPSLELLVSESGSLSPIIVGGGQLKPQERYMHRIIPQNHIKYNFAILGQS